MTNLKRSLTQYFRFFLQPGSPAFTKTYLTVLTLSIIIPLAYQEYKHPIKLRPTASAHILTQEEIDQHNSNIMNCDVLLSALLHFTNLVAFTESGPETMVSLEKNKTINLGRHMISLQHTAVKLAPILRPTPDLCLLIREKKNSSFLDICSELFGHTDTMKWVTQAKKRGVCSFCYEDLEEDDFEVECLVADYKFDFVNQVIVLDQLKIACSLCRKIASLSTLIPLCGKAVAAGSASAISLPSTSKLTSQYPELSGQVNTYLTQFIEVNDLDPGSQVSNFQASLSIAFSIFIMAKSFRWSLKSSKSNFEDLFL